MQNEETQLINETAPEKAQDQTKETKNKSTLSAAAAGAVGGFVAGAAAGAATTAAAATVPTDEMTEETVEETLETHVADEEVLPVNDEGLRVAHVEADSFSDAFAQARQQVGPGGVFEYNGQIYGTYYANEWNAMSAEERADFQNRASGIAPTHHSNHIHHDASAPNAQPEVATDAQMLSVEPVEDEVRVLGVEVVEGADGGRMTMATVEVGGEVSLMVDVNNDDIVDVLIHDDNHDNELQDSEYHYVEPANIHVSDLEHIHAAQQGDLLYASHDEMPDYVNDADSIMNV